MILGYDFKSGMDHPDVDRVVIMEKIINIQ